jgi:hypothetical protein
MNITTRRTLRLVSMAILVVGAVGTGFLWSMRIDARGAVTAGLATGLVVVMALIVESLATSAERELRILVALLKSNSDRTVADVLISDEKARELVRIIDVLTDQNSDYRGHLLSGRVHDMDAIRRQMIEQKLFPADGPMR